MEIDELKDQRRTPPPVPMSSRLRQRAEIDANIAAGIKPRAWWREQGQKIRAIIRREEAMGR